MNKKKRENTAEEKKEKKKTHREEDEEPPASEVAPQCTITSFGRRSTSATVNTIVSPTTRSASPLPSPPILILLLLLLLHCLLEQWRVSPPFTRSDQFRPRLKWLDRVRSNPIKKEDMLG